MIAKDDLGVKIGFDRISEIKTKLRRFMRPFIPVIWCPQTLESITNKAEI